LPPEDRIRLLHMIEAAETACGFISGKTRRALDADRMLVFALVRAMEIVGEAGSKVSAPTREAASDVPWPLIVSMRNRLVHACFDVDHEVIWKTATEELPRLLPRVAGAVRKRGRPVIALRSRFRQLGRRHEPLCPHELNP
jgi:uncharacterized protein with HEPN domain